MQTCPGLGYRIKGGGLLTPRQMQAMELTREQALRNLMGAILRVYSEVSAIAFNGAYSQEKGTQGGIAALKPTFHMHAPGHGFREHRVEAQ